MADWTQLPKDLLDLIAQKLKTSFDNLRFRSVCSIWRSSAFPKPRRLPNRFPILPNEGMSQNSWGFHLSKRTIFCISSPENPIENPMSSDPKGWLIKIEEDTPDRMHLLHPLTKFVYKSLPPTFPKIIDVTRFSISELGQEFVLHYINYNPSATNIGDARDLYMEKVVYRPTSYSNVDGFEILTVHVSGKLTMFRSGEKKWLTIQDMPSPYDDVMLFNEKFYAVDNTGRTVIVQQSLTVSVIAHSVFGGDKKYLVEFNGQLFMVDKYLCLDQDADLGADGEEDGEGEDWCIKEKTLQFKVFRLEEKLQKWIEVKNLGDLVLFLGDNSTFSVSASELSGCRGNCILFTDDFGGGQDVGVFDLENGNIGPLRNYPGYSELFWPPPHWITSRNMEGKGNLNSGKTKRTKPLLKFDRRQDRNINAIREEIERQDATEENWSENDEPRRTSSI